MRYFVATLICAAIALIGAIMWVGATLPPGEGSFGVAKFVPLIIAFFLVLLFGVCWFPALLIVFLWSRLASRNAQRGSVLPHALLLVVSALALVPSAVALHSIHSDEVRSKRLELRIPAAVGH
jgi:hypothetical protein